MTISMSEAKSRIKSNAVLKWKLRWARQQVTNTYLQSINTRRDLTSLYSREVETKVYRLILGLELSRYSFSRIVSMLTIVSWLTILS